MCIDHDSDAENHNANADVFGICDADVGTDELALGMLDDGNALDVLLAQTAIEELALASDSETDVDEAAEATKQAEDTHDLDQKVISRREAETEAAEPEEACVEKGNAEAKEAGGEGGGGGK